MKVVTFFVNIKSTSSSAFASDSLNICNSSFKGTAARGSMMLELLVPLQQRIFNRGKSICGHIDDSTQLTVASLTSEACINSHAS